MLVMDTSTRTSMANELAARRAKAQSYFERYPERRGQGPYVPNTKLVPPSVAGSSSNGRRSCSTSSSTSSPTSSESPAVAADLARPRHTSRRQTTSDSKPSERQHPTQPKAFPPRASSRKSAEVEDEDGLARQWHTRSSSRDEEEPRSTRSKSEATNPAILVSKTREDQSSSPRPPIVSTSSSASDLSSTRALESYRAKATAAFAARVPVSNPTPERRIRGQASKPDLRDAAASCAAVGVRDLREERRKEKSASSLPASSYARKIDAIARELPMIQTDSSKHAAGRGKLSVTPRPSTARTSSSSQSDCATVLSIEEIIRKHAPGQNRFSHSTDHSCGHGSRSSRMYSEHDDDEDSDSSSIGSVEREIQHSMSAEYPKEMNSASPLSPISPAAQTAFTLTGPDGVRSLSGAVASSSSTRTQPPVTPNKQWHQPPVECAERALPAHLSSGFTTSASAPTLTQKKSSPNLPFSSPRRRFGGIEEAGVPSRHARNQSVSRMERSASATSACSPVPVNGTFEERRHPPLPRAKSNMDLSNRASFGQSKSAVASAIPPLPPLPGTPNLRSHLATSSSFSDSPVSDGAAQVRHYVQSAKLTTLLLLARPPYAGKKVSIADVGDPNGHAVFVFLGLGAVRYLVGLYDEMAAALGLRLVCVDRWGMGRTDEMPSEQRGVLEWSNVIAEVADRLSIERFSVMAHSAGAPYAMAVSLVHGERMAGPVHLLAPWVSPTLESGYKWLRYVPDSVIRTAQAAEWRMQGWKLGVGAATPAKSPATDVDEEADTSRSPLPRSMDYGGSLVPASPSTSSFTGAAQRSFDSTSTPNTTHSSITTASSAGHGTSSPSVVRAHHMVSLGGHPRSRLASGYSEQSDASGGAGKRGQPHARISSETQSIASLAEHGELFRAWQQIEAQGEGLPPSTPAKSRLSASHHELSHTPSTSTLGGTAMRAVHSSSPCPDSSSATTATPSGSGPSAKQVDLPTALLRASHAESGGSTNDLLVILGRASQKPWGFTYADVGHAVRVWHGDKDERVGVASVLWMEREMRDCRVTLIKGATHGLMTNVGVVVEVLESIAACARALPGR